MKHFYGLTLILLLLCHTQLGAMACAQHGEFPLDSSQSDMPLTHHLTEHVGCCVLALNDNTHIQPPLQAPSGALFCMPAPVPAYASLRLIDPPPRWVSF